MSYDNQMMTFGGHLGVLRGILKRILIVTTVFAIIVFVLKDVTFSVLLAPGKWDFCTYRWLEAVARLFDSSFCLEEFHVDMIATELSSQFMAHIKTSFYLGLLCASPFIVYELFKFVSPALLENEKKYSLRIVCIIYLLFIAGVMMSYFVVFPISFRFLGTYSVAESIHSTITITSYISSFAMLTIVMGLVFQLPVLSFILGKIGLLHSSYLVKYRRYALLIIAIVAAIITPPDVFSQILVGIPLYIMYEISIKVIRSIERKAQKIVA